MKRSLIYRTLIAVLGIASIQPIYATTTFENFDPYASSIEQVDQHEELHLKTQLSGYDYDVELDTDITKALHLYFAYNDSGNGKVEGNTLTWTRGNIGSASAATDVYVFASGNRFIILKNEIRRSTQVGRRGAPAKGVGRVYRRGSSNLPFSAIIDKPVSKIKRNRFICFFNYKLGK